MGPESEQASDELEADDELDEEEAVERPPELYITELSTIVLLHVATCGLYASYWFYQHWSVQKRLHGSRISPLLRAIFPIFFVHRLFRRIDRRARASGASPAWNARNRATSYVVLLLALGLVGQSDADPVVSGSLGIVLGVASLFQLLAAQRVANLTRADDEDDPRAENEVGYEDEDA